MDTISLEDLQKLIPKVPSGVLTLPSKGLFYDQSIVKDGKIEVTPLTGRTEKLIAGIRGNNVDDVIDTILERHMLTKIPPDELLATDRFFMLVSLRANSYGEDYEFDLTCPSCDIKSKYNVKLPSDFKIQYSADSDKEPFELTLPVSKLKVTFRLLRGKDEKAIKKFSETELKKGSASEGDPAFSYRLAKGLVTVNGKQFADLYTGMQFIEKLPAKDTAAISAAIDDKTPGLLLTTTKTCVACSKNIETSLPITAEFFRPRSFFAKLPHGNAALLDV